MRGKVEEQVAHYLLQVRLWSSEKRQTEEDNCAHLLRLQVDTVQMQEIQVQPEETESEVLLLQKLALRVSNRAEVGNVENF